ncbi:unnamed protein product [Bursaphelenchus xylophilus]|uniref:(pine wood nematode) hypothetical protein n=1 Tax=Bursaphelenchus xylophilus TaxID=6326 RepID=A0A811K4A5_BURXY|nr:unnamed protein product [Bursaphelenchus xylophilus]CAG9086998.1 unnamed protein product [Bursaphelenchus xylophilus]
MCIVLTAILCISRHVYGRDVEMGVLLDQSEFPSTAMEEFYHLFEYTAFAITTVVVIFTMTVIVMSNTKGISNYRWYLIHTLLWSLFFDGMGTFIGAVTLFPVPCYYGVNLAGTTSDATQTAYFFIGVSAILGKLCSLLFQFEHRYYQTQSSTSRYHRMCSHIQGFMQIVVRFCLIILAMALVLIPFALFFPNQEEQRALLRSLDPVVASLIDQHPSLLCITAGTDYIPVLLTICISSSPFLRLTPTVSPFTLTTAFFLHIFCSKAGDVEMGVLLNESELPTPYFVQFYHRFEYTAFGISVVVVLSTMAVIVFSSTKGISKYRWYLIHTLFWSFFFDAMGTFIGAVTLFPVPCYYGVNAAGNTDKVTQTVYFFNGVAAVIGKICSMLFQFEHRYHQTQPYDSSYRIMCSRVQGYMEIVVRFFVTVGVMISVMVPYATFFPDQEEEKALLISMDPEIEKIFDQHPGMLYCKAGDVEMGVLLDESELPTPDFVQFYHRFEYTAFGISAAVVLSTMAVIVFSKTKGISKYRWYLIHTLLWSFFFDAMGTFIGAVTLFPVPCYYGVNAAGNTDKVTQTVYFFVGVAAVIGKICSLLFQFEHRYYQTQSAHSSYRYMCSRVQGFLEILVRFFLTVVFMIIVMVPFALFFPDQEEEKALLISMDPVIAKIFDQHPGTLCFSSGTDVSTVLLPPTIIVAIIPFVCCLTLYIIYTSIRTQFSANTQRLQMMLFWSLVAQMGAFFVLLIVPLLFFIGASLLGTRWNAHPMGVLLDESELPSPTLLFYYKIYENVAFSITFIMVVVTMSVMLLSTTRAISKYRWFLIHELAWSLFFDAMGSLIGAVTLFPLPCYFGVNISNKLTGTQQIIYFFVGINSLLGKSCSILFQFEYRFLNTLAVTSSIRRFLEKPRQGREIMVRGTIMLTLSVVIFFIITKDVSVRIERFSRSAHNFYERRDGDSFTLSVLLRASGKLPWESRVTVNTVSKALATAD